MAIKRGSGGRFAKGTKAGGRPKGTLDFRKVVEQKAKEKGVDLAGEVWEVLCALLVKAKGGDTRAAQIVLERLCGPVAIELEEDESLFERIKNARLRARRKRDEREQGKQEADDA